MARLGAVPQVFDIGLFVELREQLRQLLHGTDIRRDIDIAHADGEIRRGPGGEPEGNVLAQLQGVISLAMPEEELLERRERRDIAFGEFLRGWHCAGDDCWTSEGRHRTRPR